MEPLEVAKRINHKINELDKLKDTLYDLAHDKARTASEYELELSKHVLKLKQEHPISIIEKLARGICSEHKFKMDLAEGKYKNALKIIDLTQAQLNGYQSINRYLAEV